MSDDEPCMTCPERRGDDECCRCPKCGSEITRYVARDSGRSWITKKRATPVPEAIIWRCLECGNIYTVNPAIKCGNDIEHAINRARGTLLGLEDNWDLNGRKKILETTLDRAAKLMKDIIGQLSSHDIDIGIAEMFPGQDGNVEMFWNCDQITLAIIVSEKTPGHFFYFYTGSNGKKGNGSLKADRDMDMLFDSILWIADPSIAENEEHDDLAIDGSDRVHGCTFWRVCNHGETCPSGNEATCPDWKK